MTKKYQIIYADPPWSCWAGGKRNASIYYPCMDIKDIYILPVKKIADSDCVLFMWAIYPILPDCIETIKRWGFNYSTVAFTWIKTKKRENINQYCFLPEEKLESFFGCGGWTRANAEIVLLATIGNPKRANANVRQVVFEPPTKHSRKPNEIHKRIIRLCGDLPRIELFAREKAEGWDVWGNEVESDIELKME